MRVVVDRDLPGGRGCVALVGDSSELDLPECSVDSLVLDPPAGIGFMGRTWDGDRGGRDLPSGFGPWLSGLCDGESNFDIHKQSRESGDYYYCRFEISLRADDGGILHMLQKQLGGKVYHSSPVQGMNPKARWELVARAECARLVNILDRFPLQSKKARDFAIWREALAISTANAGTNRADLMAPFWEQLRGTRPFSGVVTEPAVFQEMQNEHQWISWLARVLAPAYRALKPGGHGLAWALPRTSHWTATALELAGFEVRDVITHIQGQGFPKHHAALKPASEHWILFRKPPGGSIEACVERHGTGMLSVDECRIGDTKDVPASAAKDRENISKGAEKGRTTGTSGFDPNVGRWPANLVLSHADDCELIGSADESRALYENVGELGRADALDFGIGKQRPAGAVVVTREVYRCADGCPVAELDAQSGEKCGTHGIRAGQPRGATAVFGKAPNSPAVERDLPSSKGGASRFFYCAKPAKSEKNRGIPDGAKNQHPTVKPIALMRYLIRLVTPAGGVVLDPFAGTGTTGIAALAEGLSFVGCELGGEHGEYVDALVARLEHACDQCG